MNDDDDDNDMFDHIQDPMTRLEFLEVMSTGQSMAMEEMSEQLKNQSQLIKHITENLQQFARAYSSLNMMNQSLQQQTQSLHHRIKVLETKDEK